MVDKVRRQSWLPVKLWTPLEKETCSRSKTNYHLNRSIFTFPLRERVHSKGQNLLPRDCQDLENVASHHRRTPASHRHRSITRVIQSSRFEDSAAQYKVETRVRKKCGSAVRMREASRRRARDRLREGGVPATERSRKEAVTGSLEVGRGRP